MSVSVLKTRVLAQNVNEPDKLTRVLGIQQYIYARRNSYVCMYLVAAWEMTKTLHTLLHLCMS